MRPQEGTSMKRRVLATIVALAAVMAMTGSAYATIPGTLDQSQEDTTWSNLMAAPGYPIVQTFTAGMSGELTAVAVNLNLLAGNVVVNATANVTVELRSVDGSGVPTATVLKTWTGALSDGWNTVVFGSTASVTAGTKYAIAVTGVTGGIQWNGATSASAYTAGGPYFYDGVNWYAFPAWWTHSGWTSTPATALAFRTYVTAAGSTSTPPPTSAPESTIPSGASALPLLLAALFGALAFVSIRRFAALRK
jgi:hypothetical protein